MSLGCDYLKARHVGENGNYHSRQIVGELLQILSAQIEDNVLQDLASSSYFAIMTDKCIDNSVLNQLVQVVRYVCQQVTS